MRFGRMIDAESPAEIGLPAAQAAIRMVAVDRTPVGSSPRTISREAGTCLEVTSVMLTKRAVSTLLLVALVSFSCAGTKDLGAGLWGALGGGHGVSQLVNGFAANLSKNAMASKALGAAGIESAKNGLYNSIAQTGGYGIEKGSDLNSVLKGMNLDAGAVSGIGESLNATVKELGLPQEQAAAVSALWNQISKGLSK